MRQERLYRYFRCIPPCQQSYISHNEKKPQQHPNLNSLLENDTIYLLPGIHIGIAVSLEDGLIVPVIFNADKKSLVEITEERIDVAQRARSNKLTPAESNGSTFTITNLGAFDIDYFTPIINPPEAAILGAGRIKEKVTFYQELITHRPFLPLSLSFDHRINDGVPAAAFL